MPAHYRRRQPAAALAHAGQRPERTLGAARSQAQEPAQEPAQGAATLEFALVALVLMLLVLGMVQFALWYHAQNVVLAAAQDGARLAAAEHSTATAGQRRALELLRAGLGQAAQGAAVTATRTPQVATVSVTAKLRPLLPLVSALRLRATGRSFTERFRPTPIGGTPP